MEIWWYFWQDYTLRNVSLGATLIGATCGMLSVFAVLRQQSLIGDVLSHAALPGIVLAFLLSNTRLSIFLAVGALISSALGMGFSALVVQKSKLKIDSAFAIVLSVFFGVGILLLNLVQKSPVAKQAGLERFLFGQASALIAEDVQLISWAALALLVLVLVLWKEFSLLSFDPEYMQSLGFNIQFIKMLLTGSTVLAVVIGLQTVGIVLIAALLVAPGSAARQWSDNLFVVTSLAAFFGGISGLIGAILSAIYAVPTGPLIVLVLSFIALFSLFFAMNRGILWRLIHQQITRRFWKMELILDDFYALSLQHKHSDHAHDENVLQSMSQIKIRPQLKKMEALGWIKEKKQRFWHITELGIQKVKTIDYADR